MTRMPALHRKLWRDVWRLRTQVLSIAALVACGVASVVSMYSTLRALQSTRDAYYERYRFADVFAAATRVPAPVMRRIAEIPGVGTAEPRIVMRGAMDVPGLDIPASAQIQSVPEAGVPVLNGVFLRAGRMVRPRSMDEVVISAGFAGANHLGVGDSLGVVLDGRWRRLHVVGVGMSPEHLLELAAAESFVADERAFAILWMSHAAVEGAAGMRGAFNDVSIALAPGAGSERVIAALDSVLAAYGGIGATARERQRSNQRLEDEFRQLRVFAVMLPAIFLAVAAFVLNVVLARLVTTQRSEVAALKAFGYTDRAVGAHYLAFAAVAVVIGSLAGLAVGWTLGQMYTGLYARYFRFPSLAFRVDAISTAAAMLASGAAAAVGALMAVRRAVRLPPAEALRPESPEQYRPLLLERLGLGQLLAPVERMILRTIERRPMRSTSSIIGVALSFALLAGTLALFDGAYYMADVVFRLGQREDIAVTFNHAKGSAAAQELSRLPGVMLAESFRAVPVRVRRGSIARTAAIMELDSRADLHRPVDGHGAVYALPPRGVVFTTAFARLLGLRVGDTVRVELLERGGAARRVEVAGLVDELVGANMYMERSALDQLVRDGRRVSGGYLRVDPMRKADVLARLKTMPAIAGASSRQAMIDEFDRQMAQSVRISGSLIVAFGVVIALGVVYNGARIALSERGWELASLRVLGFSRGEVARMLLGGEGLLVAAALPLGVIVAIVLTALLARGFEGEYQRFPRVVNARTYLGAVMIVLASGAVVGVAMRRRLDRLDLVAALKTRE